MPKHNCETKFMTVDETAALLRTTTKAIRSRIYRGTLPGVRHVGRRVLIDRRVLMRWVEGKHDEG